MHDLTSSSTTAPSLGRLTAGQTKLAELFTLLNHEKFQYVRGVGWRLWQNTRWVDALRGEERYVIKELNAKEASLAAKKNDKETLRELMQNMSNAALSGALAIAQSEPLLARIPDDFDADPYSLNTASGILDLMTGTLRVAGPSDLVFRQTTAAFRPNVDQSRWLTFLTQVLPDPGLRTYLQQYIGISLLGTVQQHLFAILTGTGANGKSTFVEAVKHAMGDYAHTTEADIFMASRGGAGAAGPKPHLFALMNRRLVIASETEQGARLASALMKLLTGGDAITARNLRAAPVTFTPTWTTLMVTNHLPKVQADDDALWRRLRIIPFDVVIPEEDRDPTLPDRLKLEADAILAWAYEGLQQYLANGNRMDEPSAVLSATQKYRDDSDDYARFLSQCCDITDPFVKTPRADLWQEWQSFVRGGGSETAGKPQDLYAYLESRGCKATTMPPAQGRARAFSGISILTDEALDDAEIFATATTNERSSS